MMYRYAVKITFRSKKKQEYYLHLGDTTGALRYTDRSGYGWSLVKNISGATTFSQKIVADWINEHFHQNHWKEEVFDYRQTVLVKIRGEKK